MKLVSASYSLNDHSPNISLANEFISLTHFTLFPFPFECEFFAAVHLIQLNSISGLTSEIITAVPAKGFCFRFLSKYPIYLKLIYMHLTNYAFQIYFHSIIAAYQTKQKEWRSKYD